VNSCSPALTKPSQRCSHPSPRLPVAAHATDATTSSSRSYVWPSVVRSKRLRRSLPAPSVANLASLSYSLA